MSLLARFRSFLSVSPRACLFTAIVSLCLARGERALAASFLFDAAHAQQAGNADWVLDSDSSPARFPTPDQSAVTSSTSETYWRGALSTWGIELVKRGHSVETLPPGGSITYQNASNTQDLSHYQVFVVDEPNTLFTTAEKSALVRWVQAGGSLFIIADHSGSDRNGDGRDSVVIWNDLFANNGVQAAPFGVVFNSDSLSPANETADSSATNPITHGIAGTVTQYAYASGCSLTISTAKNASVKGAVWTSSTHGTSNVMVAYGTFGAGKFVATGDSSPMDDGTGASGDTLFDGWSDASGHNGRLILNASLWLATPPANAPPANDNFSAAISVSGFNATAAGSNVDATKQTGEPNHAGATGGASVWWTWIAPSSGDVTVDTLGSSFDTVLGVYTGSEVGALTAIAADNDSGTNFTSVASFTAVAGTTYAFAVDGVTGQTGTIALHLVLTPPQTVGAPGTIASWTFDTPPYSNPLFASSGSGTISFSGWGGTVTTFSGLNNTSALALQGTAGNGTYIELSFSMTNYHGLGVIFSTRGTSTGYTSGLWSWSVNGGAFTVLPGVNTATTSTTYASKTVDLSSIAALDNAAAVRLRYTLDGSSGSLPNVRLEDLVLHASLTPTVSLVVTQPEAFEKSAQAGIITVSSSLAAGTGGLPVAFQWSGTATPPGATGADFSVTGTSGAGVVTIPEGATSATVSIVPVADDDPTEFDETAVLTLASGTTYFLGASSAATVTIHDATPFDAAWASQFPSFQGAAAAPSADLDHDGTSNLLEFAFDGNPLHSDPSILPALGQVSLADPNDGNLIKSYPTITFTRRTDAPNLVYAVEVTGNLTGWTNNVEQLSSTPLTAVTERVIYRSLTPLSGTDAIVPLFLRVRCTDDGN